MRFTKMHGLGNDYVVARFDSGADFSALARRACDRRFGVGADGLIAVAPSAKADCRMRIFNADGSEAEMCGNGVRCCARFAAERILNAPAGLSSLAVETVAGVKTIEFQGPEAAPFSVMTVDMGEPEIDPSRVPALFDGAPALMKGIAVAAGEFKVSCVSMGNPHAVIFCDDVGTAPVETAGPQIEVHPAFPKKTNVEFCRVRGRAEMDFRVWERGVGETPACGTGACAAVVAAVLNGLADRKVLVHLPGGDLAVHWREDDNRVRMTGPAEFVFEGEFNI